MAITYKQIKLEDLVSILKPLGIDISNDVQLREDLREFCKKWYPAAVKMKATNGAEYNDENYSKSLNSFEAFDTNGKLIPEPEDDNYYNDKYNLSSGECSDEFSQEINIDLLNEDSINLYQLHNIPPYTMDIEWGKRNFLTDYPKNNTEMKNIYYTD